MDGLEGISPIPGGPPPETTPQIGREDRVGAVGMGALQGNGQVTGAREVVLTGVPPVAERVDVLKNQLLRSSEDEEPIRVAPSPHMALACDENGFNVLHHAAWEGDLSSVQQWGGVVGNVDVPAGEGGETALELALMRGHGEVALHLLSLGAGVKANFLHYAAQKGDVRLYGPLVDHSGGGVMCWMVLRGRRCIMRREGGMSILR